MNEFLHHHPPGLRQLLALVALFLGLAAAQPICTVSVTPAAPQTFQAVRASVAGLPSGFTGPLTLDWGDGSSTPFTAAQVGSIAKPAPYTTSGTRTVSVLLSTRPLCSTTVSVSTAPVTFGVTPSSGPVTTTFVAAYSGLPFTTLYTLNWGDGTTQQISTPGSGSSSHTYAAPGVYTVTFGSFSAAPMTAVVTVTAPAQAPTLNVTPTSAAVGQTVTASVTDAAGYSLDWGDGTPPVSTNGPLTHSYAAAGTYTVKLFSSTVPVAVQVVTVTLPAPTLSVSPSSGLTGATFTAALGNLVQGVTYTLDWADGTTEAVTGSGNVARPHVYTSAGTFAVRLTAQGTAPVIGTVTVTNPEPTLSVTPTTADVGATFTAALGNLAAGVPYTLDWGDGTTEAVTGSGSTTRSHVYAAPGTFSVRVSARGGVPAAAVVNVTVPAPALSVTPASAALGESVTANVSGTVRTVTYTLDWGDGQTEALSGAASYTVKHTYQASGVYAVRVASAGAPPVTASVNITATAPTLSVQPSPGLVGQAITASFGSLKNLQSYTLTWGDASAPETFQGSSAPRTHTYAQPGTFQVQLATPGAAPAVQPEVITYGCTLSQTSGTVQAGQPATFTLSGQDTGGGKLAGFPAGTPYTLDWGDGSAPQAGTSAGTPLPLTHTYSVVGPLVVKATVAGQAACLLPISAELPPASLSVDSQRAGTPSTITLSGLVNSAALNYVLDFGDGTPVQPVAAAQPTVKHVYQQSGTYPVQLRLNGQGGSSRVLAVGVAVIVPAVGTLDVASEVRFAAKPGQPLPTSGTPAPGSAEIPQGVQAASVVNITAQGAGKVTLRWTWTATTPAPGTEAVTVLDQRVSALTAGPNTLSLPLPTTTPGLYTLKVEVLGDPADPKAAVPLVTVQPVKIVAVPPKVLVVGTGENQFRFTVTQVIYRADVMKMPGGGAIAYDTVPTQYDPNNFWALLTPEQPIVIGAVPVPLTVQLAQKLKISQDGDTATLLSGSFTAQTTPTGTGGGGNVTTVLGGLNGGSTLTTKADTKNPSFALPALFPMQLKIGSVQFGTDGAFMVHPLLTSPDYSQTPVTDYLKGLLKKYLQQQAPGTKPGLGPDDMRQELENAIFNPVVNWSVGAGGQVGAPVLSPVAIPGGSVQAPGAASDVLALGRAAGAGDTLLARAPVKPLSTAGLTPTGSGFGSYKGADVLAAAAARGVQTDYGVTLTGGAKLTDQSISANGQRVIVKSGGHLDLVATLGGAVDVGALDVILGKGQHDFLDFPRLELDNHGYVASARMVGGVSQASWPTPYGLAGGTQRLGSDSGVSVELANTEVPIYLDLNPVLSVQPQGYAAPGTNSGSTAGTLVNGTLQPSVGAAKLSPALNAFLTGPVADQSTLLRQTYSGAPELVKVPDVGPAWQGLVWLADNVQADSVLNADPKNPEAGNPVKFSAPLKVAAPISFGLGGWNFNIDGDLAQGGGSAKINGWDWKTSHIAIAMVRSNLIRSEQSGAVGPLPFIGGNVISGKIVGDDVTIDDSALTRAYGPDGSFTSSTVSYSAAKVAGSNQKIGTFSFGGTFDLTRVGSGLKLTCSSIHITPNLDALPYSSCSYGALKGTHSIAGTAFSVDNASLQRLSSTEGALTLSGSALGGDTGGNGAITAPNSTFTLRASAADDTLTLQTGDISQQVQNGTDNGLNIKFPGKKSDLTGVGIAAVGAGVAGTANKELNFDSGELAVSDSLTMQIKGTFGHDGGKSYWYVLANGKVDPCLSVIPKTFEVCQVYGGLAYNLNWKQADGSLVQFSSLTTRPLPDTGLHLAVGVVGDVIDKQTVNLAGVVVINPQALSLDFGGDLYLLKPYAQGAPQARFGGTLGKSGFFLSACVGPAAPLPGSKLNCSNLQPLSLVDVLSIQGRADLSVGYGGKTYFYLGTHNAPIQATVDLKLAKFTVNGYVMTGQLDGQGLPPIPGLKPATGVAAGAAVDYVYHESGSSSVLVCKAKWHFDAHLYSSVDAVYTVAPFQLAGDMKLGASASVGGSLCGVGGSVGAGIDLGASFLLNTDYGYVDGTAHVNISLPVVPDVDADFHVHVTVYGKEP